eukprot:GEMP01010006.1.p1 GENE.GEMP01010006.1~~GEMP01010006.1.p1  ORF type:complete len:793 (+),score=202.52 GEMP01010006.1:147-2525(+)
MSDAGVESSYAPSVFDNDSASNGDGLPDFADDGSDAPMFHLSWMDFPDDLDMLEIADNSAGLNDFDTIFGDGAELDTTEYFVEDDGDVFELSGLAGDYGESDSSVGLGEGEMSMDMDVSMGMDVLDDIGELPQSDEEPYVTALDEDIFVYEPGLESPSVEEPYTPYDLRSQSDEEPYGTDVEAGRYADDLGLEPQSDEEPYVTAAGEDIFADGPDLDVDDLFNNDDIFDWDDIAEIAAAGIQDINDLDLFGEQDDPFPDDQWRVEWDADDSNSELSDVGLADENDVHEFLLMVNHCNPSELPLKQAHLAGQQDVRWDPGPGANGPAVNNLGHVDGRIFIASQSKIVVYENGVRVMEKYMPARINNLVSGHGPLGATLAVTCDNGQVSLLKAKPLEVVFTWKNQILPAWAVSMHSGAVATGSNDHNVRVFRPPDTDDAPQQAARPSSRVERDRNGLPRADALPPAPLGRAPAPPDIVPPAPPDMVPPPPADMAPPPDIAVPDVGAADRAPPAADMEPPANIAVLDAAAPDVGGEVDPLGRAAEGAGREREGAVRRPPGPYRTFRGHTGNLPCCCAWEDYVLSSGLDGSLALWRYDKDSPVVARHQWMALWGCARIPKHSLEVYRGKCAIGGFPDRTLDFADMPINIMTYDVLPYLTETELLTLAQVKSHWVHVVDAELSSRSRRENVFVCITDSEVVLMDGQLTVKQQFFPIDADDTFGFAVVAEPYGNRLFIARKKNCVLQVSLFRLFNSLSIGMRVDPFPDLPASYGICVSNSTLYGLTGTGILWHVELAA